ncbi:GNAT family N-acetyltransferase [Bordetella trematum]|uniref:GNAT family N-acetyltransferase n=1 Tax=Bordetella trematum TaxID=123899 RepID=UPI0039895CA8
MPLPLVRPPDSPACLRACFALMRTLRPHLVDEADFLARIERMREQRYALLAVWEGSLPLALAGYRYQENLIYGHFLYVDDLVTHANRRGEQHGARLLRALEATAREAGCARLVLDTGLANALAQRFYFRAGLLSGAMRFDKSLGGPAA